MKHLFTYFLFPHSHRNKKRAPLILHELSTLFIASLILGLFLSSTVYKIILRHNSSLLSTILPLVIVDLTNTQRIQNNIASLQISPVLMNVAQKKANDMIQKQYFTHTSPDGLTPWHWFAEEKYQFTFAGENLAVDFSESSDITNAWMASPSHKENMLNWRFTEIGVATATGMFENHETTFAVQVFGRPAQIFPDKPTDSLISITGINKTPSSTPTIIPGKVSGESTYLENTPVVEKSETFIAVQNVNSIPKSPPVSAKSKSISYTNLWQRILVSPTQSIQFVYSLTGFTIFIATFSLICVEVRKKHMRHIMYGMLLITLISLVAFTQAQMDLYYHTIVM